MTIYKISHNFLKKCADAIRKKTGIHGDINVSDFPDLINNIEGGGIKATELYVGTETDRRDSPHMCEFDITGAKELQEYFDFNVTLRYGFGAKKEGFYRFTITTRNYRTASGSYSEGEMRYNKTAIITQKTTSEVIDEGTVSSSFAITMHVGDGIQIVTPNSNGYPEQSIKIELLTENI